MGMEPERFKGGKEGGTYFSLYTPGKSHLSWQPTFALKACTHFMTSDSEQ